MQNKA